MVSLEEIDDAHAANLGRTVPWHLFCFLGVSLHCPGFICLRASRFRFSASRLLSARLLERHANKRVNIDLTAAAGLLERSTLLTYEAIEYEPSLPSAVLQFDLIRNMLRKELPHAAVTRGCFGNAQQPVMVIPNLYFYARCAAVSNGMMVLSGFGSPGSSYDGRLSSAFGNKGIQSVVLPSSVTFPWAQKIGKVARGTE